MIYTIDPTKDARWATFLAGHQRASIFHTAPWLSALKNTYGYDPLAVTTAAPGAEIANAVVFCRVSSWITGTRLVSLPFADHCEPLADDPGAAREILDWLTEERKRKRWKYVELRPLSTDSSWGGGLRVSDRFYFHELDLRPSLENLHRALHKDSIQRKIRRAQKENLTYETGFNPTLLQEFYGLLLLTRRRLHALPQPRSWFSNLREAMGDDLQIRVARQNGIAVASILTLRHRSTVVYKYGASDERFHKLGGMPFLFWKLIEESKEAGLELIDFGRSDLDNPGLITFKDRWGTRKTSLTYFRNQEGEAGAWDLRRLRQFFFLLPDALCSTAGRILYRHMG